MTQQLGKYQLIRKLAAGGMAEVFLAKAAGPMGFEKTLVLKRILPHLSEDPAFVEMFLAEAKLAAQLNHPHIVQIFDFGEADGDYFLAMEFIDGPNLRVLLKRANASGLALPPALCARLVASACEGLAFAHDFQDPHTGEPLGLIHRDISPDNILVSRQGAVKVVDFGIAKAAGQSHKTQTGVIKGKLAYMPPEQLRAKALDRRVDVYALGVVLYELLTGHKPFEADSDAGTMQAILFEAPTPATRWQPDLPEALLRILSRALARDRERRYPDCLALAAELEEFIASAGKPVTAQQIVQLVAQVVPHTDSPVPTPQRGTPRSGSRAATTPVHTPAPSQLGVSSGSGPRSSPRHTRVPMTGEMLAPAEELPASIVTTPADAELSTLEGSPPATAPARKLWVPALASVVLLAAGGGFALWRSSGPEPVVPPKIAEALPAPTPPPSAPPIPPEMPEAKPLPEEHPSPPPDPQPPSNTAPEVESPPPEVAKTEPTDTPPSSPVQEPERPPQEPEKPPQPVEPVKVRHTQRTRSPAPKSASAQPVGKGTFVFRVRPYASVMINGRILGQTPFDPIELPAGKYTVLFVNAELKKKETHTYELKAGETQVIKLNLEE